MDFEPKLIDAIFVKRPNRFIAHIEVEGEEVISHVPNTGRLRELFVPGAKLKVKYHDSSTRKTRYSIALVERNGAWVSVDSHLPNALVEDFILHHQIPELRQYSIYKREVTFGKSRFDFYLSNENSQALMEVKGCTLVEEGHCRFPDAPTERGTKHVLELIQAVENGYQAYLFFLIQRSDAVSFSPNDEMDPAFGKAVRQAKEAGVQILSYNCEVTEEGILLKEKVTVKF